MNERDKQLAIGTRVEAEHKATYYAIKEYVDENGEMPSSKAFFEMIASDHLDEDLAYYTKLAKMEDKNE